MCISSIQHHKSIALGTHLNDLEKALNSKEAAKQKRNVRRRRVHQLSLVSLCLVLSLAATIFEVLALFNIEFCDGEDLMQMYWGFWSVLQVGSNIAILGVIVQLWIVLGDHETPSWAVALGTPVLVFAALGFVLKSVWLQFWDRCRGKHGPEVTDAEELEESGNTSDADVEKCDRERSMSQAPTLFPRRLSRKKGFRGLLRSGHATYITCSTPLLASTREIYVHRSMVLE